MLITFGLSATHRTEFIRGRSGRWTLLASGTTRHPDTQARIGRGFPHLRSHCADGPAALFDWVPRVPSPITIAMSFG